MSDFETRVLPVVVEWSRRWLKDEQLAQDAVGLCWYRYQQNPESISLPAESLAWYAIRQVRCGRRLPGEKARGQDVMDRRETWLGAGLGEVRDRSPGPERIAQMREEWEGLLGKLSARQRQLLDLAHLELRTMDLAAMFGVSWARISQLRREISALVAE